MQIGTVLLLQFEDGGHLGSTLRQILDPEFTVAYYTCHDVDVVDDELSRIIVNSKPLLILLVPPRGHLKSLDKLFQTLESAARIVLVVEPDQENLIELVKPNIDDFIIAPLRDSEVLLRVKRLLNQSSHEQNTRPATRDAVLITYCSPEKSSRIIHSLEPSRNNPNSYN